MRIGFDVTAAVRQRAGIGRWARGLLQGLAAIDQENDYLLFAAGRTPPPDGLRPQPSKVRFRTLPFSERTLLILWFRLGIPLPVDLFTGPADVFHFPNYILPPLRRGKAVVTVHDLSFLLYPECHEEGLRAFLERVVPLSVAAADFVTVDSAHVKNEAICLLDIPPDRVEVVYGGVDARFQPVKNEAVLQAVRQRYRLHFPFVLHVGVIEPRKNLVRLIEAYDRVRSALHLPHRLVLAGGLGWLYEEVFQKVAELGLQDFVLFPGYVPEEDLPALYSLADLFVYPSLYEGFGFPPLEAMACGVPVVASNAASLPEVVGDAGLLVRPTDIEQLADAIARALTDNALRAELRERGFKRARLFTWQAAAERALSIYRRVVEAP